MTDLAASSGYLLARVGAESRRRWARMLAELDLTPHHYGVLMTLDHAGTMSQQKLSQAVGVDPRNVVPIIDGLEDRTLVRREPDPQDRRRYAVTLTSQGAATLGRLRESGELVEREMLSGLSATEQADLHRLLHKLFTALT